jgi:hypothetical protein
VYCIFTQLNNSNVLGKSPIRDSNNRETGNCYWWIWQKYNTHVTVKDHIYEYTLTNTDNALYCYSNEFHSHLPFDRPWLERCTGIAGPQVRFLRCIFRFCSWLDIINVYKFPLDNFHLQYLSTIIESSEMATKSRYLHKYKARCVNRMVSLGNLEKKTCTSIYAARDGSSMIW